MYLTYYPQMSQLRESAPIDSGTVHGLIPRSKPGAMPSPNSNMQNEQDQQLVARVLAKDRAAFEEFFEIYFGRLCRFARGRMSAEDAIEDVVQETLIKAIRHLDSYRGEAQLFSWLCQICRNEVSNWYKRYGRKQEMVVSLDDDPQVRAILESLQSSDSQNMDDSIALTRIVQLTLDYLPDRYGKVLEWKYLEGLSVKEIAARLDTGGLAAQSLLARARTAFREAFAELQHELETR